MPTLNNDSPALNPIDEVAQKRSRRILGVSLGATLITVLALFAAMALAPADASANTCFLTSSQPVVTNWTTVSNWGTCGGGYPGQLAPGDTAVILPSMKV